MSFKNLSRNILLILIYLLVGAFIGIGIESYKLQEIRDQLTAEIGDQLHSK